MIPSQPQKIILLALALVVGIGAGATISSSAQTALQVSTSAVDLPDSFADNLQLHIGEGRFAEYSVGDLTLNLNQVNFKEGRLASFKANLEGGRFEDIWVEGMTVNTSGFSFDTFELLNHRRFVLTEPINGDVELTLTEDGLNHFIKSPSVLGRLEKAIAKKTGGIKLIAFTNPELSLHRGGKAELDLFVNAGGALIPAKMEGEFDLKDGRLQFSDLELSSDKQPFPFADQVAPVIEKELNKAIDLRKLGGRDFAIHARDMKWKSDKIVLTGFAKISRMEFGKRK